MRQETAEIERLGLEVAVVTFESTAMARAYVRETGVDWVFLVDDQRSLYRAYGMDRGRWWNILGWRSWLIYARLMWKGRRVRRATGDVAQLGGDVLIDSQGIVRLHHVGKGPADRPAVREILAICQS